MDLLEYQVKELFAEVGIPTLPAQKVYHHQELKHLLIPFPIALTAQVPHVGNAATRLVRNTIDAVAVTQAMLHTPIAGRCPELVLAEAHYEADRELSVAIAFDYRLRCPLLLGSSHSGKPFGSASGSASKVEPGAAMQRVVINEEFSPFYARQLAVAIGLRGRAIETVAAVVERLYTLFATRNLDRVGIHPLALAATGDVVALKGTVTASDRAIAQHLPQYTRDARDRNPLSATPVALAREGKTSGIGLLCSGVGLTLATLETLAQVEASPVNYLSLDDDTSVASAAGGLGHSLEQLAANDAVTTILVNWVGGVTSCDDIAATLLATADRLASADRSLRWVVRLAGHDQTLAHQRLDVPRLSYKLNHSTGLEAAIAACVPTPRFLGDRKVDRSRPVLSSPQPA